MRHVKGVWMLQLTQRRSTGIAVILRAHRQREGEGGRVVVHSISPAVLRVFTVTGLTGNGLVFADRAEASAAPGG